MLIVLEGCDGTGKTTLANNLAKVLDATVIHCTKETPNNFDFFKKIVDMSTRMNLVADRFMYGQFVYQTAEERRVNGWLTVKELRMLELRMLEAGARVLHVVAPIDDVKFRLRSRGEHVVQGVETVFTGFASVFEESLMPVKTIDTSNLVW